MASDISQGNVPTTVSAPQSPIASTVDTMHVCFPEHVVDWLGGVSPKLERYDRREKASREELYGSVEHQGEMMATDLSRCMYTM